MDGDFFDWSFSATGTATASVEAAGGNPGARINVTTVSGATVFGTAIKNDFDTTVALEGTEFTPEGGDPGAGRPARRFVPGVIRSEDARRCEPDRARGHRFTHTGAGLGIELP